MSFQISSFQGEQPSPSVPVSLNVHFYSSFAHRAMAVTTNVSSLSVINLPGRRIYLSINILFCDYNRGFTVSKGETKMEKDAKHQAHHILLPLLWKRTRCWDRNTTCLSQSPAVIHFVSTPVRVYFVLKTCNFGWTTSRYTHRPVICQLLSHMKL